jgi:hypothetical protein
MPGAPAERHTLFASSTRCITANSRSSAGTVTQNVMGNVRMDVCIWYDAAMGKKRMVIDLNDADYLKVAESARAAGMTVSNFVRKAVGIPLERQGVKRVTPPVKARKRAAKG